MLSRLQFVTSPQLWKKIILRCSISGNGRKQRPIFHFKTFLTNKIQTKHDICTFPPKLAETFLPSEIKKKKKRQKFSSFLPELMEISLEEMCLISPSGVASLLYLKQCQMGISNRIPPEHCSIRFLSHPNEALQWGCPSYCTRQELGPEKLAENGANYPLIGAACSLVINCWEKACHILQVQTPAQ